MELKDWVKAARSHGTKRTQEALGEALGVSKQNVNAWEKGRHEPSYAQIVRIAQLTGYQLPAEAREAGDAEPSAPAAAAGLSGRALAVATLFDQLSPRDKQAVEALATNLQPEDATPVRVEPSAAPIPSREHAG
jgi:transcriptional regulator with XRE-family HTH domain